MMEIVIKIHEKDYQAIKNGHIPFSVHDAIMKGTPLPEHHGRLIDADAFIDFLKNISKTQRYNEFIIDKKLTGLTVDDVFNAVCESLQNEGLAEGDSQTIIEADKECKC